MICLRLCDLITNNFFFFMFAWSHNIRMAQKTISFVDKKINKNTFIKTKKYLIYMISMLIKY